MKTAIITIASGDFYKKMAEITHPTIKAYADKIGSDFIVMEESDEFSMPHYLKLNLPKYLKLYDRIMYIDTDILVREDATSIFDEVPENKIGIFEEGQFLERHSSMIEFLVHNKVDPKTWNKKYYNTGVIVLSKQHANILIKPIGEQQDHFKEQSYINLLFCLFKPEIHNLHYKWNRMYALDKITGEDRYESYFMHYAGINNIMPEEAQLKLMVDDLEVWKKSSPDYKFPKNIAVLVEGGLGDQICAEPTIRYMKEELYKGDNIIVISDFPDAFSGVGLPVYAKGAKIENAKGYYEIHTLRSPEHISWEYMSHPLCHSIDFCALQAIRCLLPINRKKIELPVYQESLEKINGIIGDFKNLVVIHPGRGWDSKTFPVDVWQSYLDALLEAGYKVAVIGKRISEEQGVVEIDTNKDNCIDLIDKLNFNELTALISKARCLISNDSAPIHIAGAFDNFIGVIATCKRPDYILPYRNGNDPFYKAEALEEFKLYDTFNGQPSQVYGATIDKCDEATMRKCVPSSSKVVNFVKKALE